MYRRALALFTLVVLSGSLGSCSLCGKQEFWKVLSKLDNFAGGVSNKVPSFDTLEKAYNEFNACLPENKAQMIEKEPRVALINDFLIKPMKRFLRDEHMNEPEAEEAFAKRLAVYYRRFKPLYERDDSAVGSFLPTRKTTLLINSLAETSKQEPLTVKMLLDAKKEFESLKAKVQETVTYEDVYAEEENLGLTLGYLARGPVRALEEHIFPRVKKDMVLTPNLIKEFKEIYQKGLKERSYQVHQGELYRIVKSSGK